MGLVGEEDFHPQLPRFDQEFGIRRHEGLPLSIVGLQKMFLRPLQDKTQPMQVVQATTAAQQESEAFLDESPYHFPVPIHQVDSCLFGQGLDRSLQLGLLAHVEGGGTRRFARRQGPPIHCR